MKRCSRGIVAALLIFLVIALFLDDPCFYACGIFLLILLIVRYLLFFRGVKQAMVSVSVERRIDKPSIRQGGRVGVFVTLKSSIPARMTARYEEKIVPGLRVEDGDAFSENIATGSCNISISYRVIPFLHGNIEFPGGDLVIEDQFFQMKIPLLNSAFRGPVLKVYPYKLHEQGRKRSEFGGREVEQLRPVHGFGIRMYREYTTGDDVRNVDWKLSAKQDSLIVREFTGLESVIPLVIVDLPDIDQEYSQEAFESMISAVSSFIERALKEKVGTSLMIISGPNVISSILEERSRSRYLNIIREGLHPQYRLHHMYRMARKSHIREKIHRIQADLKEEEELTPEDEYNRKYVQVLQRHLLNIGISQFSSQIIRTISLLKIEDIYLYSLCDGDLSHIQEIAMQARILHLRFKIRTPMTKNEMIRKRLNRFLKGEIIEWIS